MEHVAQHQVLHEARAAEYLLWQVQARERMPIALIQSARYRGAARVAIEKALAREVPVRNLPARRDLGIAQSTHFRAHLAQRRAGVLDRQAAGGHALIGAVASASRDHPH